MMAELCPNSMKTINKRSKKLNEPHQKTKQKSNTARHIMMQLLKTEIKRKSKSSRVGGKQTYYVQKNKDKSDCKLLIRNNPSKKQ